MSLSCELYALTPGKKSIACHYHHYHHHHTITLNSAIVSGFALRWVPETERKTEWEGMSIEAKLA